MSFGPQRLSVTLVKYYATIVLALSVMVLALSLDHALAWRVLHVCRELILAADTNACDQAAQALNDRSVGVIAAMGTAVSSIAVAVLSERKK